MTPASAIASLDRQIAEHGQSVTLAKIGVATPVTTTAHVRAMKETEIVGRMQARWFKAILSPTGLSSVLPLRNDDLCTIGGEEMVIRAYRPILVAGTLVRVELEVAG